MNGTRGAGRSQRLRHRRRGAQLHPRGAHRPRPAHGGAGRAGLFRPPFPTRTPHDLAQHRCISLRQLSGGGLYAWEFENGGRELRVRVEGQLAFNNLPMIVSAAAAGFGLVCVLEDQAAALIAQGRLVRVLEGWCAPFAGYHLYYPSRRQSSAAFSLLAEALRHRG